MNILSIRLMLVYFFKSVVAMFMTIVFIVNLNAKIRKKMKYESFGQ